MTQSLREEKRIHASTEPNIVGTPGDDNLSGTGADDYIVGLGGNDQLFGRDGNDTLDGGIGDDLLYGENGNDTLDGGGGNDYLEGGAGNDTYLLGVGSGQDTIEIDNEIDIERILLKPDVAIGDVELNRWGSDLVVRIKGTDDRLIVSNHFYSVSYALDSIEFADGTIWSPDYIRSHLVTSDGDDLFLGTSGRDVLDGLAGDDYLDGKGGADTIDGGTGSDRIYGDDGNDKLNGGRGNDTMTGGEGNDTYVFRKGSGKDVIVNEDNFGGIDWIRLGAGFEAGDVTLSRNDGNLVLLFDGSTDSLTVSGHFYNPDNAIDGIRFANGTTWDKDYLISHISPTNGHDILFGTSGNDVMNGLGGSDELRGRAGDDTLDGGANNDTLYGEAGNDTYLFGIDSDTDTIRNDDIDGGAGFDRILLKTGIATDDVIVRQQNGDLRVSILGTYDVMVVYGHFWGPNYAIDGIEFADGTFWDEFEIFSRSYNPTSDDDTIHGTSMDDVLEGLGGWDHLYGLAGDDTLKGGAGTDSLAGGEGNDHLLGGNDDDNLYGGSGNDVIHGGAGDDRVEGGDGDDQIDGGAGNDTLRGDGGADNYLFGIGSGNDDIINYDDDGGADWLVLDAGITSSDVTLTRDGISSLDVSINGTSDTAHLAYFFGFGPEAIGIKFADGTTWDSTFLIAQFMTGTNGKNNITGSGQDDVIRGLGGDDVLNGDYGNDALFGGTGNDKLTGGDGDDVFVFDTALDAATNVDKIIQYARTFDTIQLDNAIFTQLITEGGLSASNFRSNASGDATDANDYVLYEDDTGNVYYDADGNGAGAKVLFTVIGNGPPGINAAEFVVI